VWILWKEGRSSVGEDVSWGLLRGVNGGRGAEILSWTAFHSCVEFSFDMLMMPFAVPFRMKSACP
jgi:hypothetical protein